MFKKSKAAGSETPERTATNPPTTPEPPELAHDLPITGRLSIQVTAARDLSLPPNTKLPEAIAKMVNSQQAQLAASITASSISSQRAKPGHKPRDSVQREQSWWLPYALLEFDVNEVLIDPLGGSIQSPVWMYNAHFDISRTADISLRIYLRTEAIAGQSGKNDPYMGSVKIVPDFNKLASSWLSANIIDQWYDVVGGTGQVQLSITYRPSVRQSLTIDSFELLKVIGRGSFGKVMQVRKRDTGRIYALKTIRKAHIAEKGEVTHTLHERLVLTKVSSPFIVPLKWSFQSESKLYLVLSYVNGGELFHHLQREQKFNEERSRFYAAELLLALEHLHSLNIVYRDLKPENILLDMSGHLALCDFGLCKIDMTSSDKTNTFCGTPEYLAPEVLKHIGYDMRVDWWTFGVLLYEMLAGLPPFYDENTSEMYRKILQEPLRFPEEMGSDARNLITRLLNREPEGRLGSNGAEEIKKHAFFKTIDFKKLLAKQIQPPFKPNVKSAVDCSNVDEVFTSEDPVDSVVEGSKISQTVQNQFINFSYTNPNDLGTSPTAVH
ncbi:probable Serine/threonine-protein kinase gad8 [Serendipita indica DSM 11827]|uniref:non-specific serine/threonine protein kinase n=1 Tax=Serendipita indica (strain DSM 11827) TaxID=1109443 RepID=G4T964_SERID|nr:probable Serine/threonine-protein kinase gad8 [Serendipita indica DSM 11827]